MTAKNVLKTVNVLENYNKWRVGAEMPQPSPKKITKHINRAMIMLVKYADVLEQQENFENSVVVPKEEKPKFYVGQTVYNNYGNKQKIYAIATDLEYPIIAVNNNGTPIGYKDDGLITEEEYNNSPAI